ncbi:MAG: hypothetical protein ACJART_002008 [Maribacter sp.]|jgi:hypothetical protein
MELEELQLAWTQMGKELETQKKLTNNIIMEMTRTKYKNKFKKISTYEKAGTVVCFGVVLLILVNFNKLDTWYLQACGTLCLGFLIIMPILVLSALKQIQDFDIFKGTYKENLVRYTKSKTRLLRLQQVSIALSLIMMFLIIPTTAKIFDDKDVFLIPLKIAQWVGLLIAFLGALFFSRWGYRSYQKITDSATLLLEDLK